MRRLVLAFAGHTYHIVGNLMSWLKYIVLSLEKPAVNTAVCSFSPGSTCLSNDPFKLGLDFVLLFKSSL